MQVGMRSYESTDEEKRRLPVLEHILLDEAQSTDPALLRLPGCPQKERLLFLIRTVINLLVHHDIPPCDRPHLWLAVMAVRAKMDTIADFRSSLGSTLEFDPPAIGE